MNHSFNIEIAEQYSINEAILLEHLYFWVEKNRANNKHYYDEHFWTYNSIKAFEQIFPYLTGRKISIALRKLEKNGLIITGNYNKIKYDHTKWYTITEKAKSLLRATETRMNNDLSKTSNRIIKNVKSNDQKSQTEMPKMLSRSAENVKPIPDITIRSA